MKMKICKGYLGLACVDGSCPIANAEEYVERCMDVIKKCDDCPFYKGCEDCACSTFSINLAAVLCISLPPIPL